MIKILFIESGVSGGGSFESLFLLASNINKKVYEPTIVFLNDNKYIDKYKEIGIKVFLIEDYIYTKRKNNKYRLFYKIIKRILKYIDKSHIIITNLFHGSLIMKLSALINEMGVDILYLNDQISRDYFGIMIKKKTGVKLISHLRSMRSGYYSSEMALNSNLFVDHFIANSTECLNYWINLGIDKRKMSLVANAIDCPEIKNVDIRTEFKIPSHIKYVIGCVANFYEAKGHDFLLRGYSRYCENKKDAILLLVGQGELKNQILKSIHDLEIKDYVIMTGYRQDARDIIAALDCLVVPSANEAFGRTVLEGFTAGTPVIASKIGGIKEIVKDGYDGLLFDYGDVNNFVDKLKLILSNTILRNNIILNAYKSVNDKYGIENHIAKIENILRTELH